MINETYSALSCRGSCRSLARPEWTCSTGLTTAIIVDQERLGANIRSTVGTVTDANAMLRIAVQPRSGDPAYRPAQCVLVQHGHPPQANGAITVEKTTGSQRSRNARSSPVSGGMCPHCEGTGRVPDLDPGTAGTTETKSINDGAITGSGLQARRLVRAVLRRIGVLRPGQAGARLHTGGARRISATRTNRRSSVNRHQHHVRRTGAAGAQSRCSPRTAKRCRPTSAPSSTAQ